MLIRNMTARDFKCPLLLGARFIAAANVFASGKNLELSCEKHAAIVNHDYEAACRGADCMMWRAADRDPDFEFAMGYCGLAGRPLTCLEKQELEMIENIAYPEEEASQCESLLSESLDNGAIMLSNFIAKLDLDASDNNKLIELIRKHIKHVERNTLSRGTATTMEITNEN